MLPLTLPHRECIAACIIYGSIMNIIRSAAVFSLCFSISLRRPAHRESFGMGRGSAARTADVVCACSEYLHSGQQGLAFASLPSFPPRILSALELYISFPLTYQVPRTVMPQSPL